MDNALVYLATPYSHPDPEVSLARYEAVNKKVVELMRLGLHIYSPITHNHPLALLGDMPIEWSYWERYDRLMLSFCSEMIVLRLDGWEESVGVTAKIQIARNMGMPIKYVDPTPE